MKKSGTCSVFLLIIFILNPSPTLSADNYTPVDNIVVDCGSTSSGTNSVDDRRWEADDPSKFLQPGSDSAASTTQDRSTRLENVPYRSARLSRSNFTYSFPVTAGQKFIRLYFFPATYPPDFNKSAAAFSVVAAGRFTLLDNFIPDLHPLVRDQDGFQLEFCLNVNPNQQLLNLTFSPSPGAYAFVNGIEVVSMPTNLYYTNAGAPGFQIINQGTLGSVENDTALQLMYRIKVAGQDISPSEDTGMYRRWSPDDDYFDFSPSSVYNNDSIQLQYNKDDEIQKLAAPETVYKTARGMSNDSDLNVQYNLTWSFPVDPSFTYFVRLHFCEFQPPVNARENRAFWIYIANRTTPDGYLDVIQEGGGNGFPMFRDHLVRIEPENGNEKKESFLFIALHPFQENSAYYNTILNGAEIYKLSRLGSLAGPNPDRPPNPSSPEPPSSSKSNPAKLILIVAGGIGLGLAVLSFLAFFILRRKSKSKSNYSDGGSASKSMLPFSSYASTNETSKGSSNSNLPSDLCRRFSLAEIRSATGGFDDHFIIGVGGFGDVYKGLINFDGGGGGATTVAIKRLKQGSQQGANEFRTEIEMLSQLRHLHLVSLIGYCYEDGEMILVYEYMSRGTLRDHLHNKPSHPPIPWKQRLEICIGAARGLQYLHSGAKNTIIHRDVKTTNILLDEKWAAKVSDFGLSKIGPAAGAPNAHVSTVVKGSFGYLDPEYYRLQQITEKSDVYSFGVVLWEVLTARPPVSRSGSGNNKKLVSLAELARKSCKNGRIVEIVDRDLDGEIAPECLKQFAEVAVSCLMDNGLDRPSMGDVVWGLEFAMELQCGGDKRVKLLPGGGGGEDGVGEMNGYSSTREDQRTKSSGGGGSGMFTTNSEIALGSGMMMVTTTSGTGTTSVEESSSSHDHSEDSLLGTKGVFSEILDPKAR